MHSIITKLSAISLFMILFGNHAFAQPRVIDKVIGVVGNDIILYSDVQGQILELMQNKVDILDETECILTENFLYNALLLHQAKVDSIEVNQDAIDAELDSKLQYYKQLLEQYNQTFQSAYGKSELEWREEIRDVLERRNSIEQMQAKITENVTMTPREVKAFFNTIPEDSLPRINSQVEYGQIVIKPEVSKEAEQIEIDKLNKWRQQIMDKKITFADIATLYSEDPGSAEAGGYFDCVSKGMFVPQFDAMALSLEEGEISKPFKTDYGWHIIHLEKRRGKSYCGSHILRIPKMSSDNLEQTRVDLEKITDSLRNGTLDFCKASKMYSDDEQTKYGCGRATNPRDGSVMWDVSSLDRQIGITLDQMEVGDVSSPSLYAVSDKNQAYRVFKLMKRTPPHIANLRDDYELLMNAALNDKRQKLIDSWVETKIKDSYIWISPEYHNCEYKYNWLSTIVDNKSKP